MQVKMSDPGSSKRKVRVWIDGKEVTFDAYEADDETGMIKRFTGSSGHRRRIVVEGEETLEAEVVIGKVKIEIKYTDGRQDYVTKD